MTITVPQGYTIHFNIPILKKNGWNADTRIIVTGSPDLNITYTPDFTSGPNNINLTVHAKTNSNTSIGEKFIKVTGSPSPLEEKTIYFTVTESGRQLIPAEGTTSNSGGTHTYLFNGYGRLDRNPEADVNPYAARGLCTVDTSTIYYVTGFNDDSEYGPNISTFIYPDYILVVNPEDSFVSQKLKGKDVKGRDIEALLTINYSSRSI